MKQRRRQPAEPVRAAATAGRGGGSRFDRLFPAFYALGYALFAIAMHLRGDRIGDLDIDTDFYGDLLVAAKKLASGHFSVLDYPYKGPLYPLLLAVVHVAVPDWYRAAVVLSAASAAGALVVTYHLVARVFGRAAAVPTLLLTSLLPEFFLNAHHATTDLLFLFLATSSMLAFLRANQAATDRAATLRFGIAGALAAAACLTRYNGVALPLAALLVLGIVNPGRQPIRRRVRHSLVYGATFLLVCAPWVALTWRETGKPLATRNVQNVAAALFSGPRWAGTTIADTRSLLVLALQDPSRVAAQIARNWVDHVRQDLTTLLGWPAGVLPLIGFGAMIAVRPPRAWWAYLCFPLTYAALLGAVFYAPRFFLLLVPAYLAPGLAFLAGSRLRLRPWVRPALVTAGVALAVLQVVRIHRLESRLFGRRPLYLVEAANRLREHAAASGDSIVMARKGHIAHLAGLTYQGYPIAAARSLDKLLEFAAEHHVDYIVYGIPEMVMCPDLRFLTAVDSLSGLRTVYKTPQIRIFARREGGSSVTPARRQELLRANLHDAEQRGDRDLISLAHGRLAEHYLEQGEVHQAESELQALIDLAAHAEGATPTIRRNATVGRYKLAGLLLATGRPQDALAMGQEVVALCEREGAPLEEAVARTLLADCYEQLGRSAEAEAQRRQAFALSPGRH